MRKNAILTPFEFSDAVPAGRRRFWKQILPVTKINYKGQKVDFDKKFHMDLAQSFKGEAFQQVPLVFADGANQHNMDPRNFGGEIIDMQARNDGTWALIEADKKAAKAIQANPKLGVSARIRQGLEKADGRTFGRAVEHVLLTMNPRVTGMGGWEAVDLSDEAAEIEVVDLTAATYKEGKAMATKTATKNKSAKGKGKAPAKSTKGKGEELDLSSLSDEDFQKLIDLAETLVEEGAEEDVDDAELGEVEDPTAPKRKKKSKTKITIEKDSEDSKEDDDSEDPEDEDSTDLSDSDIKTVLGQFSQMRLDLAEDKWSKDREGYAKAGVPPFLLDLAEPILSLPESMVIDLSDDEQIDATDTVRKMLDGVKGFMDLSDEIGHQIDLTDEGDDGDKTSRQAFLDEWDKQYS